MKNYCQRTRSPNAYADGVQHITAEALAVILSIRGSEKDLKET